jgi:hypothetical protein
MIDHFPHSAWTRTSPVKFFEFMADRSLYGPFHGSQHPAVVRLRVWYYHDVCQAPNPPYVWPGTQDEFDAMVNDARMALRLN